MSSPAASPRAVAASEPSGWTALSALNVVLCNDYVVALTPCVIGTLSCVSRTARRIVDANQSERRSVNQLALASVKGKLAMEGNGAESKHLVDAVMYMSRTMGSFVKCRALLAGVGGAFTIADMENVELVYRAKSTAHPHAVRAQADELWRFLRR